MPQELLRLQGVTRRITSEFYIRCAELTVYKGEVLALAGKNAAGKSTVINLINGSMPAESGHIFFEGNEIKIAAPADAVEHGIVTLVQNNKGFEQLSVADNILFGNSKYYKNGNFSSKKLGEICEPCFKALNIQLNSASKFSSLSPAQKQLAAIARAYLFDAKLIIMDEPSSHLPDNECEVLYNAVSSLRAAGVSVIYITHRLNEILRLADRVAVIEHGEIKTVQAVQGLTEADLIELTEGYRVGDIYGKELVERGESLLELNNVCGEFLQDISFNLYRGEIRAVLGGAGQCALQLCHVLLGLAPHGGDIIVLGKTVKLQSPLEANSLRIAAAVDGETEKRLECYDSAGGQKTGALTVLKAKLKESTQAMGRMLGNVFGTQMLSHAEYMTGGYLQRELIERTIARDCDIYILVDATNGIDLQAKMRIYQKVNMLKKRGCGILYFTNDAEEAMGIADRITVLSGNTVVFDEYAEETDLQSVKKLLKV
ncbi:MAG: ATP-binding cassette domain-containing protein [Hydrogenoanaerobacterium sp.]